jgi:hypothetical protein
MNQLPINLASQKGIKKSIVFFFNKKVEVKFLESISLSESTLIYFYPNTF